MEVLAALPYKFVVLNESTRVKHLAQCLSLGIYVNECVLLLVLLLYFWEWNVSLLFDLCMSYA